MSTHINQVLEILQLGTGSKGGASPDKRDSGEVSADIKGDAVFHLKMIDSNNNGLDEWEIYDLTCESSIEENVETLVTACRNLDVRRPNRYIPTLGDEYPKQIRLSKGEILDDNNSIEGKFIRVLKVRATWSL